MLFPQKGTKHCMGMKRYLRNNINQHYPYVERSKNEIWKAYC